jgi:hypothetical protein
VLKGVVPGRVKGRRTQWDGSLAIVLVFFFEALLPLPNEDVGMPKKHFRTHFRSTFQGCEYRILATKS